MLPPNTFANRENGKIRTRKTDQGFPCAAKPNCAINRKITISLHEGILRHGGDIDWMRPVIPSYLFWN